MLVKKAQHFSQNELKCLIMLWLPFVIFANIEYWIRNLPGLEKCNIHKIWEPPIYCVYEATWPPKWKSQTELKTCRFWLFILSVTAQALTEAGTSRPPNQGVWEAGMKERERLHTPPAQGVLPKHGWWWPAHGVALEQRVASVGLQCWVQT